MSHPGDISGNGFIVALKRVGLTYCILREYYFGMVCALFFDDAIATAAWLLDAGAESLSRACIK